MLNRKSIQTLLEDKVISELLRILLRTFRLEENFLQLSQRLKTSRPTLKSKIDLLLKSKMIVKNKTKVHLVTNTELFKILDKALPVDIGSKNYKMEMLQRKLVHQYIEQYKDQANFFKPRPADNFDIRETIHPSLSISNRLEITEASDSFYELFQDDVLNGRDRKFLFEFFDNVNIYNYNFESDMIGDEFVYTKIYQELLDRGHAKLDACYIKGGGEKVFLSIFVIIQTNFLGMQSIMTDITDRVDNQRVQKRLAHRFYHLISVIDTISDKLIKLNIENREFKSLTRQLNKLSSFDYLEKIYVNNIGADIDKYRDFQLNPNLQSIVEQLKFLYNREILYKPSEYCIEIRDIYDIYFYEGLYLLIEKLILKSDNSCSCTIHSYKRNGIIYIEIFFSKNITPQIELFINSLKSEILKGGSINRKHLNLKMFLDKLPRNIILELVVSTYFNSIKVGEDNKSILFEL